MIVVLFSSKHLRLNIAKLILKTSDNNKDVNGCVQMMRPPLYC